MPIFTFRGRRELFTDLQLQLKDQNHIAISYCVLARSQVGAKGAVISPNFGLQILNC